jgi:hypothetical protein
MRDMVAKTEKKKARRENERNTYRLGISACWSLSSSLLPLLLSLSFLLASSSSSLLSMLLLLPLLHWFSLPLASLSVSFSLSSSSCRCRVDTGTNLGWGSAAAVERKRGGRATDVPASSSLRSDLCHCQIKEERQS